MGQGDPEAPEKAAPGREKGALPRREFLKQAATALGAVTPVGHWAQADAATVPASPSETAAECSSAAC